MQKISLLLNRFKNLSRPNIEIRETASRVIKQEIGAPVSEKEISFKNGVVYIKTHNSVLKSEIFLKKKNILDSLQDVFPDLKIIDIK